MFSKLNQQFAKHTKAFQAVLFVIIVVPFVFFMPGVDIFGVGGGGKPDYVGSINGEEVSWEDYETQTREYLAFQVLNGYFGASSRDVLSQYLQESENYAEVLNFINRRKVIENNKGFDPGSISAKEMKEFVNVNVKDKILEQNKRAIQQGQYSNLIDFKQIMERVRYNLEVGGPTLDKLIKFHIASERFEEYIKNQHKPSEEEVLAEVKKQERTYKLRSVDIQSKNFNDVPLKEYYEKNKDKYLEKDAVKASLVSFQHSNYEKEYAEKEKEFEAELKKAIEAAVGKVNKDNADAVRLATENAKRQFEAEKLKLFAKADARIFQTAVKTATAVVKDPTAALTAFKRVATEKKFDVQESAYVTEKNLKPGNYFFDEALTREILKLSPENLFGFAEGRRNTYVLIFMDKGTHTPFKDVKDEIMEKVYSEKLDDYYLKNKKEFELPKRYTVGVASFSTRLYEAEVVDNEEEIKELYEQDASYKEPQRELIQFSIEIDEKASETEKKSTEEKLKAFVKTLESKKPEEVKSLTVKKEDNIKKAALGWKSGTAFAGTDQEAITEAFKTEVGKFTKVLVRDSMAAVVFVASQRDKTPYAEVRQQLRFQLRQEKLAEKVKEKALQFREMLKQTEDKSIKGINAAIDDYSKNNTFQQLTVNNIPSIPDFKTMTDAQFQLMQRAQNNIAFAARQDKGRVLMPMMRLSEKINFTTIITLSSGFQKVVAYVKEIHKEGYRPKDDPEVKQNIFAKLNNTDAQELAKKKAEEVKKALEAEKDPKKLTEILNKNDFKETAEVKFKKAEPMIQEALKESPAAGSIVSNYQDRSNIIVYIENIKEVTEEEIAKLKAEHEKNLTEELQSKKLEEFWKKVNDTTEIKVAQEEKAES